MAVTLTDRAAEHVQRYIAKRGKGMGLRLGVRTTGCSGLAYKLEFADETQARGRDVREQRRDGARSTRRASPYLDGTELDFAREGLNEGFKFNNPNEKDAAAAANRSTSSRRSALPPREDSEMLDFSRNHFELFGLPARYRVDPAALDAAYRELQTEVHPDRFAARHRRRAARGAAVRPRASTRRTAR